MVKMSYQSEMLKLTIHNRSLASLDDDDDAPDVPDTVPDPVGAYFQRAENVAAGVPTDFAVSPTPEDSDTLAKRDARMDPVLANRLAESGVFGTAATLVKNARTETENGVERTFDEHNELIRARVTNGDHDGGELAKGVDDEGTTVNLAKAASPHRIRYEQEVIDGEPWVLAWNDRGENVYANSLEDHLAHHESDDVEALAL
jgi:hypothetical protein